MITPYLLWPQNNPIENSAVGNFVSTGIWGEPDKIKDYSSMAVLEDGALIAGTLYHNWQPEEGVIELSSFSNSRRWLTKNVVRCMFTGPFKVLGCQMVVLRVSERNENMIGIARKFGFEETYIPRLRGRNEGEMVFRYTDDQWRSSPYNNEGHEIG